MFNLLDVAYPGRPYRPRIIIDNTPDTIREIEPKPIVDSVNAPKSLIDTLSSPQEFIDTLTNKEAVLDTLRSAMNFFSDLGTGNGQPNTLLWSSVVVFAALALCFYGVWMYRKNLAKE